MNSLTTVTQKGQITLPVKIRKKFGIKPYSRVEIEAGKGAIKVRPVKDILDMVGSISPIKGRSALKARAWMERQYKRI